MAVWSKVQFSQISNELRSDSEFFKPEYIQLDSYLAKIPDIDQLGNLSLFVKKGIFDISPTRYMNNGVPLIRTSQIKTPIANNENLVFLSKKDHSKVFFKTELLPGDIVFTKIGAGIGDVALLPAKYTSYNFSQNVAGVSINRSKINPYYLIAYLMSNLGRQQILRYMMPSGQGKLELRDIKKIRIVRLNNHEDNIASLVQKAEVINQKSSIFYTRAKLLLESELGLDKLSFQYPVGYTALFSTVGLSDTFNAGRIDAQCFSPDAIFYQTWLRNHAKCERLAHLLKEMTKGRQQVETSSGSTDYCSIKHISGHELTGVSKCHPTAGTPLADKSDLLLAITGATIGKIGIVKRYKQLAFSGDLLCLKSNSEIKPHYLLVALDHIIGQVQFNRWITGSTNGHLAPLDVGRVLIPRLSKGAEEHIAELADESLSKHIEFEKMLAQAKTRVEQLIEEAVRR